MKHQKDNIRINKEYNSFKKKIESSRYSTWFECLNDDKKFQVFLQKKKNKYKQEKENKSFSLNKFLLKISKKRFFFVPKNILREKSLNKILG